MSLTPIPVLPSPPDPLTDDAATFAAKASAFTQALTPFGEALDALGQELDPLVTVSPYITAAANYKGPWASLSGALAIPASVSHSGKLWFLLENAANVASETPGVSAKWLAMDGTMVNLTDAGSYFTTDNVEAALQDLGAIRAEALRKQTTIGNNGGTFTATPTIDAAAAYGHNMPAMTGNITAVTISNPVDGREVLVRVKQDGTGGWSYVHPTAPAAAKGSGSIGTLANQVTLIYYRYCLADTRWEYTMSVLGT